MAPQKRKSDEATIELPPTNLLTQTEIVALKLKVSDVFRPGTPIDRQDLFAGRQSQINDVLNATIQLGRHVVMFGERGVGKTSLARVICDILSTQGYKLMESHSVNCDSSDNFSTLWRKVFREISVSFQNKQVGFSDKTEGQASLDQMLPVSRLITPDDVRHILTRLGHRCLIVIDEVDRLSSASDRALLADTIKTLADHAVSATLILIGVADSVDQLIAEHQSIDRSLAQVPMQRMHVAELNQILETGFAGAGMTADDHAKNWIVHLSQGLPHYAHSLGLYSALCAIEDRRTHVAIQDVLAATVSIVEKAHSIRSAYHQAVYSPQTNNLYAKVLSGCALTKTDELGYFRASDVVQPLTDIMHKPYDVPYFSRHLNEFCRPDRGPVLKQKGEPRKRLFRFADPMMQPFVIIHDYSVGVLTNQVLDQLRGRISG